MSDAKPPPPPLYTPEFAAKRRRSMFWAMVMCVAMGGALIAGAIFDRDADGIVTSGLAGGRFAYPWFVVGPAGALLLALGLWGLWGHVTGRDGSA
jgi:hypothetical protein